jgi:hypothetical protein
MKLSGALKGFRGWCMAGLAIVAVLAMLVQPFCAPLCAARHCETEAGTGAAMMHCASAGEQREDSVAAQRHACPLPEALPALLSADGQQLRRAGANAKQPASFSSGSRYLDAESWRSVALAVPIPRSLQPSSSSLSAFAILRV